MNTTSVSRRNVLLGLAGLLAAGSVGVAGASDRIGVRDSIGVQTIGLRNNDFEQGSSFTVDISGVEAGYFKYSTVTLRTNTTGKIPKTMIYTATDDLWQFRRGVAGHTLRVPLGSFRPEIGDEVVVTVALFDEADALFGKGSTTVRIRSLEGDESRA